MKGLGGWSRFWIVLSGLWMLVALGTGAWLALKEHRRDLAYRQIHAELVAGTCRGPFFKGRVVDLSSMTLGRLEDMREAIRLMAAPSTFDQLDSKQASDEPKTWSQVTQQAAYRKLPFSERRKAQEQYFREVVRPHFSEEALANDAQEVFLATLDFSDQGAPVDAQEARTTFTEIPQANDPSATDALNLTSDCLGTKREPEVGRTRYGVVLLIVAVGGLVPPAVVLLAGLAIAWIYTGFRKHTKSTL